jgi:methylenetetrahydrofolate reductase (NADPH)
MALRVSFEFFPPKSSEAEEKLWASVLALAPFGPAFVSVTYGAGGSTRERTHHTVRRIREETDLKPAAHLTCVGASRAEIDAVARGYWEAGIRHIVALRGDPPQAAGVPASPYVPHPEGYRYAADLMRGLKDIGDFEISVAAFPEKHPESRSFDEDMRVLKGKQEAGAARAITQYFFDTDLYLRLRERVRKAGIRIPLVPGLVPIGNFAQLKRFSAMCGATVPDWLCEQFEGLDNDHAERDKAAIALATKQAEELIKAGAEHLHFYTLNRADLTAAICRNLGLKPS